MGSLMGRAGGAGSCGHIQLLSYFSISPSLPDPQGPSHFLEL